MGRSKRVEQARQYVRDLARRAISESREPLRDDDDRATRANKLEYRGQRLTYEQRHRHATI